MKDYVTKEKNTLFM